VPNGVKLYKLTGVQDQFELNEGVPRAANFPEEACYSMHPDAVHNTVFTDTLLNRSMLIIISPKLRDFLRSQRLTRVEYLPISIRNHKGKVATRDYCILHPIDPVDCLDLKKSKVEWGMIDKTCIDEVTKLVIDETKIEPSRAVFRMKSFFDVVMVRRDLAEKISKSGFTGIEWTELQDFES